MVPVNPYVGMVATRVRDFTRMNLLEPLESKVEEDPREFINEVYKVLIIMGLTPVEKSELASYQHKEEKLKERSKEEIRAKNGDVDISHSRTIRYGRSMFRQSGHHLKGCPLGNDKGNDGGQDSDSGLGSCSPKSENENVDNLRMVLQVLKDHKLFAKFSKYEFSLRSMDFLGHIVSGRGIEVVPKKKDVVKSWPRPLSPSYI
ncbi:hypothetical protein MTR67_051765 [Solanum verrucosum]|uniref:Gag-pol polyprotein n=1 Tax=Solanum verrucosum TaxID=315347 RepID=A0AAF0V5R7_SOLVR|nr:hypothetical protein MTR67_051765 [Solanum verrucosum]